MPCTLAHEPQQRFVFDRYMGKYCGAAVGAGFCLQEAFVGPRLRLRLPGDFACLQFDGALQALKGGPCNVKLTHVICGPGWPHTAYKHNTNSMGQRAVTLRLGPEPGGLRPRVLR